MSINPKDILKQKILKAAPDCPEVVEKEQLQQVGIDLRIDKIYLMKGVAHLLKNAKVFPEYYNLFELAENEDRALLKAGNCYAVDTMEYVEVPENMYATVLHRSTLNRMGSTVMGSIYDPGFRGVVCCCIRPNLSMWIEKGVRIAQIVFENANAAFLYDGSYQDGKGGLEGMEGEKK